MEFRLLGPLSIHEDGREVPITGLEERSMLAILLLPDREYPLQRTPTGRPGSVRRRASVLRRSLTRWPDQSFSGVRRLAWASVPTPEPQQPKVERPFATRLVRGKTELARRHLRPLNQRRLRHRQLGKLRRDLRHPLHTVRTPFVRPRSVRIGPPSPAQQVLATCPSRQKDRPGLRANGDGRVERSVTPALGS
jgi:hypothetical protein